MIGTPADLVCRVLLAPVLVVAVAVLFKGYQSVGDGFAAGLIVAAGILLQYVILGARASERSLPLRGAPWVAATGLLLVLAVASQSLLRGGTLLEHAPGPGGEGPSHLGSIELSTAFLFDVGVFLLVAGSIVTLIHAVAVAAAEGRDQR